MLCQLAYNGNFILPIFSIIYNQFIALRQHPLQLYQPNNLNYMSCSILPILKCNLNLKMQKSNTDKNSNINLSTQHHCSPQKSYTVRNRSSLTQNSSQVFNLSVLKLIQNKLYPLPKNRSTRPNLNQLNSSSTTKDKHQSDEHKKKQSALMQTSRICPTLTKHKSFGKNSYEMLQGKVDNYLRFKRKQLKQKFLEEKEQQNFHGNKNQIDQQKQEKSNIGKYIAALKRQMSLTKSQKQIENIKAVKLGKQVPFQSYTSRGVDRQLLRDIMQELMDQKSNKMRKNFNHKKIIKFR